MSESHEEKNKTLAVSRDVVPPLPTIANRPSCGGLGRNAAAP
jgi:hypothetical protein